MNTRKKIVLTFSNTLANISRTIKESASDIYAIWVEPNFPKNKPTHKPKKPFKL